MYKPNKTFLICLFVYCVLVKVLPFALVHLGMNIRSEEVYPWSFTPIFAFGIFGVAMFRDIRLALGLPLLAWLMGDLLIGLVTGLKYGFVEGLAYSFYPGQVFQYLGLILCSSCGGLIRVSRKWPLILTAALAGPTLFFAVSNFGVWFFDPGVGYPRDLSGLWQAYLAGVPFYRNQLISTASFALILFSPIGVRQLVQVAGPLQNRSSALVAEQTSSR